MICNGYIVGHAKLVIKWHAPQKHIYNLSRVWSNKQYIYIYISQAENLGWAAIKKLIYLYWSWYCSTFPFILVGSVWYILDMCLSFARNCSSTNQSKYLWRLPSFSVMPFFKGFFLWYTFPAKRKRTCNLVCRSVDIKQLIIWAPKKEIVVCLNIRYIKIPWKIKCFFKNNKLNVSYVQTNHNKPNIMVCDNSRNTPLVLWPNIVMVSISKTNAVNLCMFE